ALEDAIELARCLDGAEGGLEQGLQHYEDVRSVEVLKIQNAARNSTEWFENVQRYADLDPEQFAYSLLTRSQRISHENLRVRDPAWLNGYEGRLAQRAATQIGGDARENTSHESNGDLARLGDAGASSNAVGQSAPLPMLTPYRARGVTLKNRIVVSPMAMYSCTDGVPGEFHLVHL